MSNLNEIEKKMNSIIVEKKQKYCNQCRNTGRRFRAKKIDWFCEVKGKIIKSSSPACESFNIL